MPIISEENNNFKVKKELLGKKGRLLAIDVGTKRLGLAVSDELRFIANPKLIIKRQSNLKDFEKILAIIEANEICSIIIGLPLNEDGSESEMSKFAIKFAQNFDQFLKKKYQIFLFDERFSSSEARHYNYYEGANRKKNKFYDDIAASVILQHFLDEL